jgi:RHS repeat-associated protein
VFRLCTRAVNGMKTRSSSGKERDNETGLDYFGARYLSAAQGRFTSADAPFADQHQADPQSWNLYTYVRNNPLKYIDPNGEKVILTNLDTERDDARKKLRDVALQRLKDMMDCNDFGLL